MRTTTIYFWIVKPCVEINSNRLENVWTRHKVIEHLPSRVQVNLRLDCTVRNCDQIYQKGSYTRMVSGLTFHGHSTGTTIIIIIIIN